MKEIDLYVTDHAVLRYLERVQGQPIEQVRAHIRSLCIGPASLKAKCVRAEGVKFEIDGNRVVTVVPDSHEPGKESRARSAMKARR